MEGIYHDADVKNLPDETDKHGVKGPSENNRSDFSKSPINLGLDPEEKFGYILNASDSSI